MSGPLQLFIDVQNRQLVRGIDTAIPYTLPDVYQGDSLSIALRFLEATGDQSQPYTDIDYSLASVVVGVGSIGLIPSAGFFTITDTVASETTASIAFNATASAVQTAIQTALTTNWSTATVIGAVGGPYTITNGADGAQTNLVGTSISLTPISSVVINNLQTGTAHLPSIQYLQLVQNPIALQDTWTASPAPTATVSRLQAGSGTQNEIQQITLGNDPYAGAFVVNFGSATSSPIQYNATASAVQTALQAMTSIGAGNCSVGGSVGSWVITFTGTLALAPQSLMTTVATGLVGPLTLTGTLALNTTGIEVAIGENSSISPLFAIQVTPAGGGAFTVVQTSLTINNDLIVGAPTVPSPGVSYYTTAASDARYFQIGNELSEGVAASVRSNLGLDALYFKIADNLSEGTAATIRTNLGLNGVYLQKSNNLSDVTAATAISNLGLDARYAQLSNNLSDVTASTARTNLGLVIGTNVQAHSATLDTLAAGSPITAGTNVTVTGTWPALTIAASGGGGGSVAIGSVTGLGTSVGSNLTQPVDDGNGGGGGGFVTYNYLVGALLTAIDISTLTGTGTGVVTALGQNADSSTGFVTQSGGDARYAPISVVGPAVWTIKTANYTAVAGDKIQADTSGGAFTITLPASAATGDAIVIEDATLSFATHNLTIARNGLKINGGTTDYTASVVGSKLSLVYLGATYGWSIK